LRSMSASIIPFTARTRCAANAPCRAKPLPVECRPRLWRLRRRSAIEIASGRLFAGRPPAWTLPRRSHRRPARSVRSGAVSTACLSSGCLGVQRLKSPLEGFSPGVHLRGRCHSDRPGVQRLKSPLEGFSPGVHLRGRCHGDRPGVQRLKSPLEGFSPGVHLRGRCHGDRPGVQRLKSPLEGFSPGVHLRGRCHGDRIGGRPARSVRSGAASTAGLSSGCLAFSD